MTSRTLTAKQAGWVRVALGTAIEYEDSVIDAHTFTRRSGARRPIQGYEDVVRKAKAKIARYRRLERALSEPQEGKEA